MKRSEANAYRAVIETAMDGEITDETALTAVDLFPKWDSAASYETGRRVRYEGVLYKCLQSHAAQAGWDPVSAPSLWARVLIEDPDAIPEWVQPESTNGYAKGDRVAHNGIIWVSIVDDNVWEPGVYGWEDVS